jgi:hypothetical protein
MITITIKTASLLSELKVKSYMNTLRVVNPDDRYAVRAGEENESELKQAIQDAWREAIALCRRFLDPTDDTTGTDATVTTLTTTDQTLTFDVSVRRSSNFGATLAEAIHEFLVAGSLRRFYTSAAEGPLVQAYAAGENAARDRIVRLLHTKTEPIYDES